MGFEAKIRSSGRDRKKKGGGERHYFVHFWRATFSRGRYIYMRLVILKGPVEAVFSCDPIYRTLYSFKNWDLGAYFEQKIEFLRPLVFKLEPRQVQKSPILGNFGDHQNDPK